MRTLVLSLVAVPSLMLAQGRAADYERSAALNTRFQNVPTGAMESPTFIGTSSRFWYRKDLGVGSEFILVNPAAKTKLPAFDHAKVAASLNALAKTTHTATTLPFTSIEFVDGEKAIEFTTGGGIYQCPLADYACKRTGDAPAAGAGGRGRGRGGVPDASAHDAHDEFDHMAGEGPPPMDANNPFRESFARLQQGGRGGGGSAISPDQRTEAYVRNGNIYLRPAVMLTRGQAPAPATADAGARGRGAGGGGAGRGGAVQAGDAALVAPANPAIGTPLTTDGVPGFEYSANTIRWAPDGRRLIAYRARPAQERRVQYVISSPANQFQPSFMERNYAKPGDTLTVRRPVLFDLATGRAIPIDTTLFPNAYNMTTPTWRRDGRAFVFDYNERGHMNYRVIEVDTAGRARAIINEETKSFFYYNGANSEGLSNGKNYKFEMNDGREIIWMSERDGWNHLYLYDGAAGRVKNQITKGEWVVRSVQRVDTVARQIYFVGTGMNPKQDPYFANFYRINFDGTGLVAYTEADGNHSITWSPDREYYIDTWSRVDLAPQSQLRKTSDRSVVMELEKGDLTALKKAGWSVPEVFVSKARDGKTDIWGVIYRPTNFNPGKKYPVIEYIYAGPHGSFVPKPFSVNSGLRQLAELGFIVSQVDGMGTSNRSKAFHDVAWKNLGDGGFPDRILWHQAINKKYPYYDITRVGIYGTSAGGQSSTGALLFHPEFYKVAVSAAGCHDNRMDKIWWNEQWMGWPIGPQYAASSNMENAAKLKGKLLLVVGELDTNVDPASTMQVVNALIRANKTFDLLVIPNADHTDGGPYGQRKRNDYFVHHLLGVEPPDRNTELAPEGRGGRGRGGAPAAGRGGR